MRGALTLLLFSLLLAGAEAAPLDLSRAVVVVRGAQAPQPERTAATVLIEEIERRTGIRLATASTAPESAPAIVLSGQGWPQAKPEGYQLRVEGSTVRLLGADARGALFAVGALLRKLDMRRGRITLDTPLSVTSAPAYPIRGHQLGYRSTANSWDAWTVPQFEQYIRELALFGINSVENIPFQDARNNPLMKVDRREMNRAMSEICRRHGLDYWVWTPADFDLNDATKRAALLAKFDELFADCPELTGIFVPGGDPGSNPPELLWPLFEDVAQRMKVRHPNARIWLSLQGFNREKEEAVYRWLDQSHPAWLGGLVAGPSSPPALRTRQRLDPRYKLRLYPDVTHNKICQYQVPELDQAIALTLGREAINPRPAEYAGIHNKWAGLSDGFLSYSDGVHDDVNKTVWSALSWDPARDVRGIVLEYTRVFFGPGVAEESADGILALERNWHGSLIDNGAVEGTLATWQRLETRAPELASNWRWQMNVLRAVYDAYVRRKLINETQLEEEANAILAAAKPGSTGAAMDAALAVLNRAVTQPVAADLRARIVELCERLFQSIGLQTSVEKYHASGAERGAVLDFIDNPLNNRWWLEDEFKKVRALTSEPDRAARLHELAAWEHPGEGSFYDDIGNQAKSPHVFGDLEQESESFLGPEPLFWWWDDGRSRARLSWQTTMWPRRMVYDGLDPNAVYVVRTSGFGQSLLSIDGQRVKQTVDGKLMGEYKEFPVPAELVKDRRIILTWQIPTDEGHLNWRQRSRLAEVWLLRGKK